MAIEKKNRILKLKSTSAGSTFNRGDFTIGNAFFWSSLDLSPYHGTDLGSTPYYIEVLDAAGKKATGYLAGVGAGEMLGNEKLINPSFDVDTNGWLGIRGTIASILGGQSGKCLEITRVSDVTQFANAITAIALATGGLFKFSGYHKSGSSGNEATYIRIVNYADTQVLIYVDGITSNVWVAYSNGYVNAIDEGFNFNFWKISATPGTMLFDTASLKRVTDPPATAVHIVSSLNGMTRDWASIESGFDSNTITSWIIYEIFYPNIKNKFSKTSIANSNIWLSSPYHNQSLITSRLSSISLLPYLDYLIGWYWNDEAYGSTVYNMAINGILGGGLLPNLNVFNSSKYWSNSGFSYSPYTHTGNNLAKSYSFCDFSKIINQNSCFGMFIKRIDLYTSFSQKKVLEFTILNPTFPTDYIAFGLLKNPTNYYAWMYRDSAVDSSPFVPTINTWYFLFIDDTDIPKIAKPDGTLYTFSAGIVPSNKLMEKLILGASWNGTSYVGGPGSLLGDTIIFNNLKLSQSNWGLWYDALRIRYGMDARSW